MRFMSLLLSLMIFLGMWAIASGSSTSGSSPLDSPSTQQKIENNIKSCKKIWEDTKELGNRFRLPNSPGLLASKERKEEYDNEKEKILLYKEVYKVRLQEFTDFTDKKIKLNREKTSDKKINETINSYNRQCKKFADDIADFVEWAVTGQLPKERGSDDERIYATWIEEVKKQTNPAT